MKGTELLSELLLPKEIHIYFDVTKIEKTEEKIEIYLEERNEMKYQNRMTKTNMNPMDFIKK